MSYYKEIDGIKYDKAILDIADEQIKGRGDGRLSEDDMKLIIKSVIDRKKITKIEYFERTGTVSLGTTLGKRNALTFSIDTASE